MGPKEWLTPEVLKPRSILPVPVCFVASDTDSENPDSVRPDAARVKDAALIKPRRSYIIPLDIVLFLFKSKIKKEFTVKLKDRAISDAVFNILN
jgi:hypothetical protein